jgi:GT2 family glycosyltransferase
MAFRKHALSSVKGFDAQFFGNALREESDAVLRMQERGYKIASLPQARLTHLAIPSGGTRTGRKSVQWYYNLFHNETLFFSRHRSMWWGKLFVWRMLRPFFACWLYYGRGQLNYLFAPIRGVRDGYHDRKRMIPFPKPQ